MYCLWVSGGNYLGNKKATDETFDAEGFVHSERALERNCDFLICMDQPEMKSTLTRKET